MNKNPLHLAVWQETVSRKRYGGANATEKFIKFVLLSYQALSRINMY